MKYTFIYLLIKSITKCIFSNKIKGVNIGGWLVLEPWITPSLFYQFLGKTNNNIAMDMYTFCDVLGPKEANKQLREHWSTWIDESYIKKLSDNNINLFRIPIGDWMYIPYGPYLKKEDGIKCTDGSIEELDKIFNMADKYNIDILLDLHCIKGSQNGFDNSGQTKSVEINDNHFKHWEIRTANWIGDFDIDTKKYINIDNFSIEHSKKVLKYIIVKYSSYNNFKGLTVLNEPWEYTPDDILKNFYQEIFDIFQYYMASDKLFIIHDSFRSQIWEYFYFNNNNKNYTILLDTHQYTAWNNKYPSFEILINSSNQWQSPRAKYKYIIGEWSLAIDNCEMWLNGFMDNIPNYPLFECSYKKCPKYKEYKKYLDNAIYGPFGTGISYPNIFNECPVSISLIDHFLFNEKTHSEKELAKKLFIAKSKAFEKETYGWIFWNFRTESQSYQWDYLAYIDLINNKEESTKILNIYIFDIHKNYIIFLIIILILILFLVYILYKYRYKKKDKYNYIPVQQYEKTLIYKEIPLYNGKTTIDI
jgi:glucan 1,3-beta-glucosidase